jgi:uncharacterized membrane protein
VGNGPCASSYSENLTTKIEQRYGWAAKISRAVVSLSITPTASSVYVEVWAYINPLLLFHVNFKRIWQESGRLLIIFLAISIGSLAEIHLFSIAR